MSGAAEQMAALAADFRRRLPERLQTIAEDFAALRSGQGDWEATHRAVHSLVGTAGTFGLADVARRARALEMQAKLVLQDAPPDWPALNQALAELLETAQSEEQTVQVDVSALPPLARPATLLLADDDTLTRRVLTAQLKQAGHRVIAVEDGLSALECLASAHRPELVLMDITMPVMDGLTAVRRLREEERRRGDGHVPVIFLTADDDPKVLHEAIRRGGDDLLVKPCSPVVLDAKIHAQQRMADLNRALARYRRETEQELAMAERVMRVSLSRNDRDFPGLTCASRPAGRFSGDALFVHRGGGCGYVLLADFTGHGLPAAVGTLIAADVFHAMADKGLPGEKLLRQLNDKLCDHLPTDIFCAACLVQIDGETVRIWNRGLPDAWWVASGQSPRPLPSTFLPLGVMPGEGYDIQPQTLPLAPARLLLYTDGLNEAVSPDGRPFGLERVARLAGEKEATARIMAELTAHLDGRTPQDDVTLAALDLGAWC